LAVASRKSGRDASSACQAFAEAARKQAGAAWTGNRMLDAIPPMGSIPGFADLRHSLTWPGRIVVSSDLIDFIAKNVAFGADSIKRTSLKPNKIS
jgi:hypothetical protein